MLHNQNLEMPTKSSDTNILHVNDDCLLEIFSYELTSIFDLCSVAEAHPRFKQAVGKLYGKHFKIYNVIFERPNLYDLQMRNIRRILSNFGPFISGLTIDGSKTSQYHHQQRRDFDLLFDWVIECCSNTLESIELKFVDITPDNAMKLKPLFNKLKYISLRWCYVYSGNTLFSNKMSLVELGLVHVTFEDQMNAFTNTFSKLVRLVYENLDATDIFPDDFFSRHQKLKTLSLCNRRHISRLVPMVADNCRQLAELKIIVQEDEKKVDFKKALSSILTLGNLNTLIIDCRIRDRNLTRFIQGLKDLKSLKSLSLLGVDCDSEFVPALSNLSMLQVLLLQHCKRLGNLNPLASSGQLAKVTIFSRENVDGDIIALIRRLINLKALYLSAPNFKMDQQMYGRIVGVVRAKPVTFEGALEITCRIANDGSTLLFADFREIVKIIKDPFVWI